MAFIGQKVKSTNPTIAQLYEIELPSFRDGTFASQVARTVARTLNHELGRDIELGATSPTVLVELIDDVIQRLQRYQDALVKDLALKIDRPALAFDNNGANNDYTLSSECRGCWITVDTISVHICRQTDGVSVEMSSALNESGDPLTVTDLTFEDARSAVRVFTQEGSPA